MSRKLGYSFDLLYDIKTSTELITEIRTLASRLSGLLSLCAEEQEICSRIGNREEIMQALEALQSLTGL